MISNVITLKQLEALIWVVELGGFRKAAQHLNTTQPNISARINGLETTLGVVLMHRDAGSVRITPKGEAILTVARRVVNEAEALVEVAERPDLIEDRLRLGVTEMVACTWLHRYLRRLKDIYPAVSVELTVDLSSTLDDALTAGTLDLAIQTAPFGSAASGEIALGAYPYFWVAAPDLAAASVSARTVADLTPHGILTHARHTQAFRELTAYAEARALPVSRFVSSSSIASCLQMAKDGLGVALLPSAMVQREISAAQLIALKIDWTPAPLRFAARFQSDRGPRFVAQAARIAAAIEATERNG